MARNPNKQYVPLESNEPQVIGSITNQLLYEILSELREVNKRLAVIADTEGIIPLMKNP